MLLDFPVKTFDKIERHLKKANIKYHIEDNEFYLTEHFNFPCWLVVNDEQEYILIKMRQKIKSRRINDNKKILKLVNKMNKKYFPNTYYYDDGHIYADCYQFLDINAIIDNVTPMLERCVVSFMHALKKCDVYRLIAKDVKSA